MVNRYAGFWERVLAHVLDVILMVPAFLIVLLIMQDNLEATLIINIGLLWLYQAGLESTFWRGTIGKRIVGIQVTDLSGNKMNVGRALLRNFVKIINISWVFIPFTGRKQALHDLLANTIVVKG
ncbi:MAG: hypothetical protein RLZZ267_256 [Bacillota bacterium]|jgi:uncharacterized RDD family membrane protein YckC